MNVTLRTGIIVSIAATWFLPPAVAEQPELPYPAALEASAIVQDRLDDIMDNSLIVGNGDINAVLYAEGIDLVMRLTKNDVWDARIDTSEDPPLLKIDVANRKIIGTPHGPLPSWNRPYPTPRTCARLVLGPGASRGPTFRRIRAAGSHNAWEFVDGAGVMRVAGREGDSNGYLYGPLHISTDGYNKLRVELSGTGNAKFYIDVMGENDTILFKSNWLPTPVTPQQYVFDLPGGEEVRSVILYAWTSDGQLAENRFAEVVFEGPAGRKPVDLTRAGEVVDVPSRLDLRRAVATVDHPDETQTAVRALAQQNAFLIDSGVPAHLEPVPASYLPAPEVGSESDVQWITQLLPADPDWPGMTFAVALAEDGRRKAVAIVTSLETPEPRQAAIQLARATLAAEPAELVAEHEAGWEAFWSASGVQLADQFLQTAWYRNLYFLRCVSKPGVEAIGLYASLTRDEPYWHGSHTLNYNSQQTFWAAYNCNHAGLAEPYERMIFRYLPRARWFCRETYGIEGAHFPHNIFTHEVPDPTICKSNNHRMHAFPPYAYTIGVSGHVVHNLWLRHKYHPDDRKYLETIAYPAVRDVARFYANFIDQCHAGPSGRVELAPSYSPEHWSLTPDFQRNRNSAYCLAWARFTLKAAIEGAATLGRDAELAARFEEALAKLPDYPTTSGPDPVVVDVQDAPPITYNITVPTVPVFPAEQVTVFSCPEEQALFRRTIDRVQWNGNNAAIMLAVARARLDMPGSLQWLRAELEARSRPNGTLTLNRLGHRFNDVGHYTEQFAAAGAVVELLLQSVGDIIRVFPAWPENIDARFVNLRAQGGFLVSAERKEGRLEPIHIESTAGGKLRVLSPWQRTSVLCPETGAPSATLEADPRGIITLDTRPGERIVLTQSPPE